MDALYSAWTRWRVPPELFQKHWRTAYENLERLRETIGDRLVIVRYEDFSSTRQTASKLLDSLGLPSVRHGTDDHIHGASRSRWKSDHGFGFQLDQVVAELAIRYGYLSQDLVNGRQLAWPLRRMWLQATRFWISQPIAFAKRQVRQRTGKSLR